MFIDTLEHGNDYYISKMIIRASLNHFTRLINFLRAAIAYADASER